MSVENLSGGCRSFQGKSEAIPHFPVSENLMDTRIDDNCRHTLPALFRQSVFSGPAGQGDTNDAQQLCDDPANRHTAGVPRNAKQSRPVR